MKKPKAVPPQVKGSCQDVCVSVCVRGAYRGQVAIFVGLDVDPLD